MFRRLDSASLPMRRGLMICKLKVPNFAVHVRTETAFDDQRHCHVLVGWYVRMRIAQLLPTAIRY